MQKILSSQIYKITIFVAILVLFFWFVIKNINEIHHTLDVTISSITWPMLGGFLVILLAQILYVLAFKLVFSTPKIKYGFWEMVKIQLSVMAVNVLIFSANASGVLVLAEENRNRGGSGASAAANYLSLIVAENTAISALLLISVIYLFSRHEQMARITIPAVVFVLITAGLYYLLFAVSAETSLARRILESLAKVVGRIAQKLTGQRINATQVVKKLARELGATRAEIASRPKPFYSLVALMVLIHLLRIAALYIIFYSLGVVLSPNVLLAAYIIGVVLVLVAPSPSGVGFVEGAMYLMFVSLKVPSHVSSTATIIFRFMAFWLPFFVGLLFLQQGRLKKIREGMENFDG